MGLGAVTQQQGTQALGILTASGADVTQLGTQELDGTPTTHYRAVIDLRRSAKAGGVLSGKVVDQMIAVLGDSTTMDVWIDGDGYTRRIEYGAHLPKQASGATGLSGGGEMHYVFELSDFGEPVHVVAPPDSEVVSLADAPESLLRGLVGFN
jgi:hypothetical protein